MREDSARLGSEVCRLRSGCIARRNYREFTAALKYLIVAKELRQLTEQRIPHYSDLQREMRHARPHRVDVGRNDLLAVHDALEATAAQLERARALGANATINYRTKPEWQEEVLRLTDGRGVDLTLDLGGAGSLPRSLAATRMGGTVSVIGRIGGTGEHTVDPVDMISGMRRMSGVFVGSRAMLDDLMAFLWTANIHPIIDREFSFTDAPRAYEYLQSGRHFGKVVIRVAS